MLAFSLLVAGSFSLGTLIANDIDPVAVTVVRFIIAGAILGALAAVAGRLTRAALAAPWRYAVLGALFALYFVLMFEGLKTAPAVSAAAVFTLTPIMTGLFAWIIVGQIVTRRMGVALAVGAAGAVWVIFRGDLSALLAFEIGRGEAIYFLGCVAHAIYPPMVRRLNRGEAPVAFTFGMILGALILLLVAGGGEVAATDWSALTPLIWGTLVYLGVVASAATFVLLQYATLRLPSAKVMAYTYMVPTWVIGWEIALGKGVPPVAVLGGVALTVAALVLLLKSEEARG